MADETLIRVLAIGGGILGAIWGLAGHFRDWRLRKRRLSALRSEAPAEAETFEAIRVFGERHRRYEGSLVAAIVGFVLLAVAAIPGTPGIVALIAIPLVLGGFVIGIESYKCPRCRQPPVRSWRLGGGSYPATCSQCGIPLRHSGNSPTMQERP